VSVGVSAVPQLGSMAPPSLVQVRRAADVVFLTDQISYPVDRNYLSCLCHSLFSDTYPIVGTQYYKTCKEA